MKTNKDLILFSFWAIWIILGIIIVTCTTFPVMIFSWIMVGILLFLTVLRYTNSKFDDWLDSQVTIGKYVLADDEKLTWNSIERKAIIGYQDYLNNQNTYNAPWVFPHLTKTEYDLLNKIHKEYYGDDWFVVDPLSASQVHFIMYTDVMKNVV